MIKFILEVFVCEHEDPDGRYERLYKKMTWPTLPRIGESFQILETGTGSVDKVSDVQHWVDANGNPQIHVEIPLKSSDYKRLQKSPLWNNELHDL